MNDYRENKIVVRSKKREPRPLLAKTSPAKPVLDRHPASQYALKASELNISREIYIIHPDGTHEGPYTVHSRDATSITFSALGTDERSRLKFVDIGAQRYADDTWSASFTVPCNIFMAFYNSLWNEPTTAPAS